MHTYILSYMLTYIHKYVDYICIFMHVRVYTHVCAVFPNILDLYVFYAALFPNTRNLDSVPIIRSVWHQQRIPRKPMFILTLTYLFPLGTSSIKILK